MAIKDLNERAKKAVFTALAKTAIRMQRDAVLSIQQGGKSGTVYRHNGIEHQASAPGEAPATDTGHLASNIAILYDKSNLEVQVRARSNYARFLEFGTMDMEARPFMAPAYHKHKAQAMVELIAAWKTP